MDQLGRIAILDKRSGQYYLLAKKDYRLCNILAGRLIYSLILCYFTGILINWYAGLAVGIILLVGSELYYRRAFLPSLDVIKKFKPVEQRTIIQRLTEDFSAGRIAAFLALTLILAPTFVLNAYYCGYEGAELILNYALTVFCLGIAGLFLYCLIIKLTRKKSDRRQTQ